MEKAEHLCPICGKPTVYYMGKYRKDGLCMKHSSEFKEGKIILENNFEERLYEI